MKKLSNYLNKNELTIFDLLLMLTIATIFATYCLTAGIRIYGL